MYKTIDEKTIQRIEDGAWIPIDKNNTDYQIFLKWLDEGNKPIQCEFVQPQ